MSCVSCRAAIPADARFCPSCGYPAASLATAESATRLSPGDVHAESMRRAPAPAGTGSASGWLTSSDSISHGRFAPGDLFDARYRVIGLLGRGGMGEAYRADNLRLGQPVALKLLPEHLRSDSVRLAQFHNEVRTARQVSHPNVCRVYDIGEADGLLYLSMEYVDGEDLATSLRRIGRFPEDKAIDLARQLCAGLAAAHQRGIIHRDLKPANIMLDSAGRVRVMDFGLAAAGLVEDVRAGTPAYMAPEQLLGREVTPRSDIFALGLALVGPWRTPWRTTSASTEEDETVSMIILIALAISILMASALLARKNLRQGRGDLAGAARLAVAMSSVLMLLCSARSTSSRRLVSSRCSSSPCAPPCFTACSSGPSTSHSSRSSAGIGPRSSSRGPAC